MQALSQLSYTPQGALMSHTADNKVSHSIKAKSPEDGALERLRARELLAERTGLEPATPGVTGRYSNRLNYRCASVDLRPILSRQVVGDDGIEPPTLCL